MAAIRNPRDSILRVSPTAGRRLGWLIAATVIGWMTATIVVTVALLTGATPGSELTILTLIGTATIAAVLYGRFQRLGRVDEPLVLCLLICWAATMGLLSL